MSTLVSFTILLAGMAIGTLICGLIPLSLPLSRRMLRVLGVFAAGLLVGASITVVIPEGSRALFAPKHSSSTNASLDAHADWAWSFIVKRHTTQLDGNSSSSSNPESQLGSSILLGFLLMFIIDQLSSSSSSHKHDHDNPRDSIYSPPPRARPEAHRMAHASHQNLAHEYIASKPRIGFSMPTLTGRDHLAQQESLLETGTQELKQQQNDHRSSPPDSSSSEIEFLPDDYDNDTDSIQKRPNHWASSTEESALHLESTDYGLDLTQANVGLSRRGSRASLMSGRSSLRRRQQHTTLGEALTTIIGLLIHALADGIAMGASAGSGDQSLTMIVFLAVMVHKAPAAFGLCSMLMSQRLSRSSIRKAIVMFSLASPVGALLTFLILPLLLGSSSASSIDSSHIGLALCFSGGTFLFVAFHAVSELASSDTEADNLTSPFSDSESTALGKYTRIGLLVFGAWTPRLLQMILAKLGGDHSH